MSFEESLKQLKEWCDLSRGKLIEISTDNYLSFESLETYDESQIKSFEARINWSLPEAYKLFLNNIGKSNLFMSEYGLGLNFFDFEEIVKASEMDIWESWEDEKASFPFQYVLVGAETGLGDFFGFVIGNDFERNFDVFSHEYPPFEYIGNSDELNSWKKFDDWIIKMTESFGLKRL